MASNQMRAFYDYMFRILESDRKYWFPPRPPLSEFWSRSEKRILLDEDRENTLLNIVFQQESFWKHFQIVQYKPIWILILSLVGKKWCEAIPLEMSARMLTDRSWCSVYSLSIQFGVNPKEIRQLEGSNDNQYWKQHTVLSYVLGKNNNSLDHERVNKMRERWRRNVDNQTKKRKLIEDRKTAYANNLWAKMRSEGMIEKEGMHKQFVEHAIRILEDSPLRNIRFYYYIDKVERVNLNKYKREFQKQHGNSRGATSYAVRKMMDELAMLDFDLPFNQISRS